MISFFASPAFCAPAPVVRPQQSSAGLVNLFRLLDDFDSYHHHSREAQEAYQQRQLQQQRAHEYAVRRAAARRQMQAFKPRFDVLETQTAYELQGELPGIERENLVIEFADPQTLVVRGRVERGNKPETQAEEPTAPAEPEAKTQPEAAEAATTTTETENDTQATPDDNDDAVSTTSSKASSQGWHHATVEDDPEEPATPRSATPVEAEGKKPAAAAVPAPQKSEAQPAQIPKNNEKLWLYERSVGEFTRAFTFAARVEHEGVTASLENGVLRVTVPKAKAHQPRRIVVF